MTRTDWFGDCHYRKPPADSQPHSGSLPAALWALDGASWPEAFVIRASSPGDDPDSRMTMAELEAARKSRNSD
jgi:hypothetical protein